MKIARFLCGERENYGVLRDQVIVSLPELAECSDIKVLLIQLFVIVRDSGHGSIVDTEQSTGIVGSGQSGIPVESCFSWAPM